MTDFVKDLDELLHIAGKRVNLTRHLEKNYKENVHYIKQITPKKQCHGGQNKIIFLSLYVIHNIDNNQVKYLVGIGEHAYRYSTSTGQITLQTLLNRITTDTFHSS